MNCPKCNVALQMAERKGIEIDFCPQCRGVWLDRGELDKIIERTYAEMAPQQTKESYQDSHHDHKHDDHHHGHHGKKRKGLLWELFD